MKYAIVILIGIALNLQIALGSMDILMMLILPIHKHSTCFHLFVSFYTFFFSVLQFSEYRSFTYLIKFIPRCLIFLVAILNETSFLVSLSDSSLLVYKNAINFWILTLYPAILPNSLIRSSSFLLETIGFSMYTIVLSMNNDSFTSSFTIWMPFTSFSCLITVVRTFSTMLNKSGKSGHPCLVPYFKGKLLLSAYWVWYSQ